MVVLLILIISRLVCSDLDEGAAGMFCMGYWDVEELQNWLKLEPLAPGCVMCTRLGSLGSSISTQICRGVELSLVGVSTYWILPAGCTR